MKNLEVFILAENKARFDQEFYKLVKLAEKFEVAKPTMRVGEKSIIKCVINDYKSGDGMFGMWELYLMEDEKGNCINKFGTINSKFLIKGKDNKNDFAEIGDTVFANAIIKSHDVKGSINVTMLGRLSKAK